MCAGRCSYQVHFGANYAAGKPYSWTTDLETVKRSVAWQLEQLRTDYIDYGFIHCMDESGDWRRYVDNGVLQFLEALKAQASSATSASPPIRRPWPGRCWTPAWRT